MKKLPRFKNVAQESLFWKTHDSTEYIDWTKAKPAKFLYLEPSTILSESDKNSVNSMSSLRGVFDEAI